MSDNLRLLTTTIQKFTKGYEDATMRNQKLLALFQNRGLITYGNAGRDLTWQFMYRLIPMIGWGHGSSQQFTQEDQFKQATLPYRGYRAGNAMDELERLKNREPQALINYYSEITPLLLRSMTQHFGLQLFVDGSASGNELGIHGFESWLGAGSPVANGYVAAPDDNYAGFDTDLQNFGGAWTTSGGNSTWPLNTGDVEYDAWSPLLVDYTDTQWQATTKTWANTASEVLRFARLHAQRNTGQDGQIDLFDLNGELYRQFLQLQEVKEQLFVQRGMDASELYRLGFRDVVNWDGIDITWEYGIPSGVGYGVPLGCMELASMEDTVFKAETPDTSFDDLVTRFGIHFFGNLKCKNIRHFVKLAAYS